MAGGRIINALNFAVQVMAYNKNGEHVFTSDCEHPKTGTEFRCGSAEGVVSFSQAVVANWVA